MIKPVGGRGQKAPYVTTTKRIPVDLAITVDKLVEQYRLKVLEGVEPDDQQILSLAEALVLSRKLLKAKKSKLDTVTKLVAGIYRTSIEQQSLVE